MQLILSAFLFSFVLKLACPCFVFPVTPKDCTCILSTYNHIRKLWTDKDKELYNHQHQHVHSTGTHTGGDPHPTDHRHDHARTQGTLTGGANCVSDPRIQAAYSKTSLASSTGNDYLITSPHYQCPSIHCGGSLL